MPIDVSGIFNVENQQFLLDSEAKMLRVLKEFVFTFLVSACSSRCSSSSHLEMLRQTCVSVNLPRHWVPRDTVESRDAGSVV